MPAYWLEILVVLLGLGLLMMEAFSSSPNKELIRRVAIGGLVFILVSLYFAKKPDAENAELARYYAYDRTAIFFKTLSIAITILVLFMSYDFRKVLNKFTEIPDSEESTGEYYTLPVFACAGMMWAASARDLVSIFVSLELITITFYILVAYMRRNVGSLEAGVKYLILGALSTAIMVYGIAWIYGTTGSTNLEVIGQVLDPGSELANPALAANPTAVLFGLALMILAIAFKVGAVPMHIWIPDVYQGAPTPTTAFLSVGSKAAGIVVALRLLKPFLESSITGEQTTTIVLALAGLTMFVGNLAAIPQSNFKRLLAYSSIAHAGVMLLAIAAWNKGGVNLLRSEQAVAFILGAYFIMTTGAFFVLVVVNSATGSDNISAFEGLGRTNPLLAFCTTVILAALAGLPLTVGFFSKFHAIMVAVDTARTTNPMLWWGIGIAIIGVACGFYYYFKVVRSMYWRNGTGETIALPRISKCAILTITIATLILGVWPNPILWLIGV